ncbi:MAG: hypothetical protein LBB80_07715 [Treponema sp.]|jgi:hypothetical protein|nr:hypothetical protein [Treponema sp.]
MIAKILEEAFFWSVYDMRQSQKKYFTTRSPNALKEAKAKEKLVDKYIDYYRNKLAGIPQQGELYE